MSNDYRYVGCYWDNFVLRNQDPNVYTRSIPNQMKDVSSVNECAQIAEDNNATVFGVQNGKACFIGDDLEHALNAGPYAGQCAPLGNAYINQVYTIVPRDEASISLNSPTYNFRGCYNDSPQDLAVPIKTRSTGNDSLRCATIAQRYNATVFGIQNGYCYIGSDENQAFKYG